MLPHLDAEERLPLVEKGRLSLELGDCGFDVGDDADDLVHAREVRVLRKKKNKTHI